MLPRAARGASIRRAAPRPVHTVPEQTRKWHPGHRRRRAAKQAAENVRKTTENDAGNTRHVRIFVLYMPEIPDAGARIGRRSSGPRAASASPLRPRPPTADERARTRADCRTCGPAIRGNGSVLSCRAQNRTQVRVLPGERKASERTGSVQSLSGAGGTFLRLARPKRSDRRCDKIYDRQCIIAEKNDR